MQGMELKECPLCGGEIIKKEVEKLIRGGNDIAAIIVSADACSRCGEVYFSRKDIELFEGIKEKLKDHEVESFVHIGRSYQVA